MKESLRIMVVDDEVGIRKLVSLILEDYQVETFGTVDEALTRLQKKGASQFDVIITDMKMPGKDELDLVHEAEAHQPPIPVILMTGHADQDSGLNLVVKKSLTLLVKPFEDEELLEAISNVTCVQS